MLKLASVLIFITTLSFAQPKLGIWRGVLSLNPEKQIELPFNFEIKKLKGKHQLIIRNAQEQIVVDEIKLKKDSFNFKMARCLSLMSLICFSVSFSYKSI